jgi:hypothetical protein
MRRPLTKDEATNLQAQGWDASEGQMVEVNPHYETSATGAATRSAIASAAPTFAGGAGFAAGANPALPWNAAAIAAMPETFGISGIVPIISGALSAYGAGKIASKAQEAVMPEEFKRQLAVGAQEHPVASFLGGAATMPLGGLRPSLAGFEGLAGGGAKLLTGAPMTARQAYGLKQALAGAGMGMAQEAATAKLEGRDINAKDLAISGGLGLLNTAPTPVIGKMFGFHPYMPGLHELPAEMQAAMKVGQAGPGPKLLAMPSGMEATPSSETGFTTAGGAASAPRTLKPGEYDPNVSARQNMVQQFIDKHGLGMTRRYVEAINNDILSPKGLTLRLDGSIVDGNGMPVKGVFNPKDPNFVTIRPPEMGEAGRGATLDTIYHEAMHARWEKMTPAQRAQYDAATAGERANLNAVRAKSGMEPVTVQEHFAGEGSMEYLNRALNVEGETGFQKFKNDFVANFKRRWGMNPTSDEIVRSWNYQMMHEGAMPGFKGIGGGAGRAAVVRPEDFELMPPERQLPAGAAAPRQLEAPPTDIEEVSQAPQGPANRVPIIPPEPRAPMPPATAVPAAGAIPEAGAIPRAGAIPPASPIPYSEMTRLSRLPATEQARLLSQLGEVGQLRAGERPVASRQWYPFKGENVMRQTPEDIADLAARNIEQRQAGQGRMYYSQEGLKGGAGEAITPADIAKMTGASQAEKLAWLQSLQGKPQTGPAKPTTMAEAIRVRPSIAQIEKTEAAATAAPEPKTPVDIVRAAFQKAGKPALPEKLLSTNLRETGNTVEGLVKQGVLVPHPDRENFYTLGEQYKGKPGIVGKKAKAQTEMEKQIAAGKTVEEASEAATARMAKKMPSAQYAKMLPDDLKGKSIGELEDIANVSWDTIKERLSEGKHPVTATKMGRPEKYTPEQRIKLNKLVSPEDEYQFGRLTEKGQRVVGAAMGQILKYKMAQKGLGKLPAEINLDDVHRAIIADINAHGLDPSGEGGKPNLVKTANRIANQKLEEAFVEAKESFEREKTHVSLQAEAGEGRKVEDIIPAGGGPARIGRMRREEGGVEEAPTESRLRPEERSRVIPDTGEEITPIGTSWKEYHGEIMSEEQIAEEQAKKTEREQRLHQERVTNRIAELRKEELASKQRGPKGEEPKPISHSLEIAELKRQAKLPVDEYNREIQLQIENAKKRGDYGEAYDLELKKRDIERPHGWETESPEDALLVRANSDLKTKRAELKDLERGMSVDDFMDKHMRVDEEGQARDPLQAGYMKAIGASDNPSTQRRMLINHIRGLIPKLENLSTSLTGRGTEVHLPRVAEQAGTEYTIRDITPGIEARRPENRAKYTAPDLAEYNRLKGIVDETGGTTGQRTELSKLVSKYGNKHPMLPEHEAALEKEIAVRKKQDEIRAEREAARKQLAEEQAAPSPELAPKRAEMPEEREIPETPEEGGLTKEDMEELQNMQFSHEGLKGRKSEALSPEQGEFLNRYNDEVIGERKHQARIWGATEGRNIQGADKFDRMKAGEGRYIVEDKKGFTTTDADTPTGTHETIHSFINDHEDLVKEMIDKNPFSKQQLFKMSDMLYEIGYNRQAIELGHAINGVGDLRQQAYDAFDEIVSRHADTSWHKVGKGYAEKAEELMKQVFGKQFLDRFHETLHTMTDTGVAPGGEGAARWDNYNKKYYSSEGLRSGERHGFLTGMTSAADRVENVEPRLASAGRRWDVQKDVYEGWANDALKRLSKYDAKDVDRVADIHRQAFRSGIAPRTLTGKDAQISQILKDYYHTGIGQERRDIGMPRTGMNEWYVPDQLSSKALNLMVDNANSPEAKALRRQWEQHLVSSSAGGSKPISAAEAKDTVDQYLRAIGSASGKNYLSVNFGALRKAEGLGLPDALREKSASTVLQRYGRRAAADMAFYKEMESKPEIAALLGLRDKNGQVRTHPSVTEDFGNDPHVKEMMQWVTGNLASKQGAVNNPLVNSVVRLIHNTMMGTATGLRDTASVPMNMLPYIDSFSDVGAALRGLTNYRKETNNAIRYGANKPGIDRVQFAEAFNGPNRVADLVNTAGSFARMLSGREGIEQFNRNISFAMGKEMAANNVAKARIGNARAKEWLQKMGTLVDGDPTTMHGADLEHALNIMAKNVTDKVQGSYGMRGLPTGAVDSQLAPFFAIQKWGIEKANTIYKDVINPAIKGRNYKPLLLYSLGGVMTGAGIEQLNKLLTGKKSEEATMKEVQETGKPLDYVHKLVSLMQLGSYAGIVGDTVKTAADVGIYGKTGRAPIGMPTASALADTSQRVANVREAIRNGEDPARVIMQFASDVLTQNIQNVRSLANYTWNADKVERANKQRDLAVFQHLEGKPGEQIAAPENPYLGLGARQFRREEDMAKAAGMVPELIQEAKDYANGDIEKFVSGLILYGRKSIKPCLAQLRLHLNLLATIGT